MNIQKVKISEVKNNPNNPRILKDDKFRKLVQSIKDFPKMLEIRPIVVNDEMIVLGGNMRLKACKEAGLKEIHIIKAESLTQEQQKEFIIKDNIGFGEWDWEQLANEWDNEDLENWGLDVPDFEVEEEEDQEDDYEEPENIEELKTDIVEGDLITFEKEGKDLHRLLCGDSTKKEDVELLMNGKKADIVFTDPPYKIETKGGCKGNIGKGLNKQGKDIDFISNFDPSNFLDVLPYAFNNNKINAYVFCNKDLLPNYLNWAIEKKYSYNVLIWKKPNAIPIGDSHRPDIEYLLLFRKSAIWNNGLENVNYSRCLEYGRETGLHPTMKPIDLICNELKISSNKNSIVFDFFLGSGSTMVASHQLNRRCFGLELTPKYCQVITDRMKNLDSELIIKKNGKLWHTTN